MKSKELPSLDQREFMNIMKHIETLTETFYVVNVKSGNVGYFNMTKEKADQFHSMINKWMEDTGIDCTVSNISIETLKVRLEASKP